MVTGEVDMDGTDMNETLLMWGIERVRKELKRQFDEAPYMRDKDSWPDLLHIIIFCSHCEDGGAGQVKDGCDWHKVDAKVEKEVEELAGVMWPYVADMFAPTRASVDAWQRLCLGGGRVGGGEIVM